MAIRGLSDLLFGSSADKPIENEINCLYRLNDSDLTDVNKHRLAELNGYIKNKFDLYRKKIICTTLSSCATFLSSVSILSSFKDSTIASYIGDTLLISSIALGFLTGYYLSNKWYKYTIVYSLSEGSKSTDEANSR